MQLTTYMLSDGARVNPIDGKLYIFGGRWDRIYAATVPAAHPMMTIVLIIELEYTEALKDHALDVVLRTADGTEVGPRATASLRVGHPPDLEPGSSMTLPITIDQPGIKFPSFGRYEWVISLDGETRGRLPISVMQIPAGPPTFPGMMVPGVTPPSIPES